MGDRDTPPSLSPLQFHILLALTDRPLHGYGILRDLGDPARGSARLGTGALYTAIARLVTIGLIHETDRRDADDARRRYYSLTVRGRVALRAEATRLERLLARARRRGVRPVAAGRS
jgi:DNA-binding PadR family transcriptional regulator